VKLLGGPDHPAIGFAIGAERVVSLLEDQETLGIKNPDLFIAALGETAEKRCFNWTMELRKSGLWVEMEYGSKGLKFQMKKADRMGAKKVLIVGDDEIASGKAILRDMKTKVQKDVNLDTLVDNLKKEITTY
jgi:histidyl-tRNA synthetase